MKFLAKNALPIFAALAFTFSAASAQTAPAQGRGQHAKHSPQEMAQHQAKRLTKTLGLSADQSAKVAQIMEQRAQDMQAMHATAQASTDRQQLRQQMQANRAKYDDQLKAVLTPDQFGKYTAMREERRHHGQRPEFKDGKFKAKDGDAKFKAKTTQS